LGIKTLTAVSDCVQLVKDKVDYLAEQEGIPYIYRLPEDEGVYADFCNKDTDSSFQFNSDVIKNCVTDFRPEQREHLSALTALMRPGAMDATLEYTKKANKNTKGPTPVEITSASDFYLMVRKGEVDPQYTHPDLEPFLKDTYGVIVYQEQVMAILVNICNYTLEETDTIRSAIAKKKQDVIMNTFARIREATAKRDWTAQQTETLCQQIQAFSRYSFNRSHSYAYAELGYITMYLKHHHPLEWWASVLNVYLDDENKVRQYISKLGNLVRPPSLKYPTDKFAVREINGERYIVTPLSAIKGVGPAVVKELCTKGPFPTLEDFVARIDHAKVNSGGISYLIKGRVADDMMDMSIVDYGQRRLAFIAEYKKLRKKELRLQPDLEMVDPLSVFLMEREHNQAFNKHLLSDKGVVDIIKARWPALMETGRPGIPLIMGDVPVLSTIKVAEGLHKKGLETEVGMILLFESSSVSKGLSKKTGRPWCKLAVYLSDGYSTIECTQWDRKSALGWDKNSIVYVRGKLKEGWKTPVNLTIEEIERIE